MRWTRRIWYFVAILAAIFVLVSLKLWNARVQVPVKSQYQLIQEQTKAIRSLGATIIEWEDDQFMLYATSPGIKDQDLAGLRGLRGLRRIILSHSGVVAPGRYLKDMPDLEWADLSDTPLADSDLEYVGQCRNLQVLSVSNSAVKGPGLRFLAQCRYLESLELSGCTLSADSLRTLASLPMLRFLDLDNTGLNDTSLASISELPSLRMLKLSGNQIHGRGLKYLRNLHDLEFLSLFDNPFRQEELNVVAELSCKRVEVGGSTLGEESLRQFARIRGLAGLVISVPRLTKATLNEFAKATQLRKLEIRCGSLGDGCIEPIGKMRQLEEFIATAPITDEDIASLASLGHLKRLDLYSSRITEKGVPVLKNLRGLTSLTLVKVPVGNSVIEAVCAMRELTHLGLGNTLVDEQGAARLAESGLNLEYINLNDTRVTDRGRTMLERRFPHARVYVIGGDSGRPNPLIPRDRRDGGSDPAK